ncbi:uncharacterized protein LOC112086411 [Eutrema salsugineum]|uniref:uncharacterized protein LOC112086411 n=1 Tax=Eutrema salsugineum TaxID=72664 RepID=UPI000CED1027|nr:uncharacterized protein LOC112086411 [Eutrema salsugineum]
MELSLPDRIFAAGKEPVGERVNCYHKSKAINNILSALDEEEKDYMRKSPFGKLIATAEKPSLSESFGHVIITRLLKVSKKYEIWILFAGRPIRVSLREFAIVTGLPCGKYPKKQKKKKRNPIREKPYWPDLFGNLKTCSIKLVVKMLKKKTVVDRETRLKYACLALTGAVLCPTNHRYKIVAEHVELIRSIEEFFSHPWGRVGFEMLMSSIKSKDEVALAQSTVAVKGFFHAIQLVLVEACPSLTEVVQLNEFSSESESEGDEEEGESDDVAPANMPENPSNEQSIAGDAEKNAGKPSTHTESANVGLSPSHAREIDEGCKVSVFSIIPDDSDSAMEDADFSWSDEEDDPRVDNMVNLIGENFEFRKNMFQGGLSQAELAKMRLERKEIRERKEREKEKAQENAINLGAAGLSSTAPPNIAELLSATVKAELAPVELKVAAAVDKISTIETNLSTLGTVMKTPMEQMITSMQEQVISNIIGFLGKSVSEFNRHDTERDRSTAHGNAERQGDAARTGARTTNHQTRQHVQADVVINDAIGFANNINTEQQTDMQQEGEGVGGLSSEAGESNESPEERQVGAAEGNGDGDDPVDEIGDEGDGPRRGKRARVQTSFNDFHVDPKWVSCTMGSNPFLCHIEERPTYFTKFARLHEVLQNYRVFNLGSGTSVNNKDVLDIAGRTKPMTAKMMDALLLYAHAVYVRHFSESHFNKTAFLETKFTTALMKTWSKFSRLAVKDRHRFKFGDGVMDHLEVDSVEISTPERLYLPFNFDREHWVGIVVDTTAGSMHVLDCNLSLRTDSAIKKELAPISMMLSYVLKQSPSKQRISESKPYVIVRPKGIPQNSIMCDSGVTTALLIMLHSVGGIDRCKMLTPEEMAKESQVLAVKFFEEFDAPA